MRTLTKISLLMVALITMGAGVMAQDHGMMMSKDSTGHTMMNVADFKWMDAPPGLPKGAKIAVLAGDPSKEGTFTIRLMLPKDYAVKPHWHPTAENITVIKGTFYMGTMETFDKMKAQKLEMGGFASMPPKFVHYAFCDAPVVLQIHGMGPFAITYINKNDDPRNMP